MGGGVCVIWVLTILRYILCIVDWLIDRENPDNNDVWHTPTTQAMQTDDEVDGFDTDEVVVGVDLPNSPITSEAYVFFKKKGSE